MIAYKNIKGTDSKKGGSWRGSAAACSKESNEKIGCG
jgi:hypothetical protein